MDTPTGACKWIDIESRLTIDQVAFQAKEGWYVLRQMKPSDYSAVRQLLPHVSRCSHHLDDGDIHRLLQLPTYYPFCCFALPPLQSTTSEGETLCGFCELYILPHLGREADGRLERVVVDAGFRGRGIASAMCAQVIKFARETLQLGRIDLTVEKPDAKHIYTKLGFSPVTTETLRRSLSC